ncbi:MAG TPA: hypothetical protein VM450_20165 [Thermomicrobiales bacterium]|nr:hypothetical protein [Thermomicrobiales bacterium]
MFENYEIEEDDASYFVPDWRNDDDDDTIDHWQVVFIDDELPSLWETVGATEEELIDER